MSETGHQFKLKDLAEIAIGACVLVIPLAITEEAWNLGRELPLLNILLIVCFSYTVIAVFVYYSLYHGTLSEHSREFRRRVLSIYLVTLAVAALCLLAINKLPLLSEPIVAIKRTILVSLPGCFLATVVDSMP